MFQRRLSFGFVLNLISNFAILKNTLDKAGIEDRWLYGYTEGKAK